MAVEQLSLDYVLAHLAKRRPETNKGSFGKVLAAAGSMAYRGAAALAAEGALRGGAGLVYLATVEPVLQLALVRTPEVCACGCRTDKNGCILPDDAVALREWFEEKDAILLAGPGLGESTPQILSALLPKKHPWRGVVLDADALTALAAEKRRFTLPEYAVLTPHPGEMARLLGKTVVEVQADRETAALDCAQRYHCVVVLKGHETLITDPEGNCLRNTTGNPGLARGGSGDVLAGLIAALLAQGLAPLDAAACGVWLHGAAADRCAKRLGELTMLPHDIFEDMGALLAEQRR